MAFLKKLFTSIHQLSVHRLRTRLVNMNSEGPGSHPFQALVIGHFIHKETDTEYCLTFRRVPIVQSGPCRPR